MDVRKIFALGTVVPILVLALVFVVYSAKPEMSGTLVFVFIIILGGISLANTAGLFAYEQ